VLIINATETQLTPSTTFDALRLGSSDAANGIRNHHMTLSIGSYVSLRIAILKYRIAYINIHGYIYDKNFQLLEGTAIWFLIAVSLFYFILFYFAF
jgi:hypothetical protein